MGTGTASFEELNKNTYFIHSNYIRNEGVIKELTKNSKARNASKTFMIGTLNYK